MDNLLKCHIQKVAVLGAGVMGAQIAAHFSNAGIPVILFDLPAKGANLNELVEKSAQGLLKLKPNPLMDKSNLSLIQCANYEEHLPLLRSCDLVLESIAERMDWKEGLYKKIVPHLNSNVILASNTSGLSLNRLAELVPPALQSRFCGVHFFNPPRYMSLIELIPVAKTDNALLEQLEAFMTTHLGKNVVYGKDTPNFVANRVGVFSMLVTLHHAEKLNLPFEIVDALTGPVLGRPRSATLRTADVVGLDTFAHTITTMRDGLPNDPWHQYYTLPGWLEALIKNGALGQKTQKGIYQKVGKDILVFDVKENTYRPSTKDPSEEIQKILAIKSPVEKFKALKASTHAEAQFLWACFRDVFHYCAYHLADIADNVRSVDQAIRWGFGWKVGPFETWQMAGWQDVVGWIQADIAAGKTLSSTPLPGWTHELPNGPYEAKGAYSPALKGLQPRRDLSTYQRQLYPDPMLAETPNEGQTVFETDAVRMWHAGDDVAVVSFKSKMCAIGNDVLEGVAQAVERAEKEFTGLVIWQRHSEHFSAGANLKEFVGVMSQKNMTALNQTLDNFQKMCLRVRYSNVPVVAAARGYVFGGGCELMLHCDRVVAAAETYIGLVEAGVGLLPAGGGCKEMALRAANGFLTTDPFQHLETYFKQIAMAQASSSAQEAKAMGYLRSDDIIVMHPLELLYVAKQQVHALSTQGYRPPAPPQIKVTGIDGISRIQLMLVNMKAGLMISDHDELIANKMAEVLCGGRVDAGTVVDEHWLLRLERECFIELASTEKTLQRVENMLNTGKPLRN